MVVKESKLRHIVRRELVEIGDTTDTYNWEVISTSRFGVYYEFSTPEYDYEVSVEEFIPEYLAVEFGVRKAGKPEPDFDAVTDEGKQFKVVATVLDIVKHAWNNRRKFFSEDTLSSIKGFAVDAASKSGYTSTRSKLYRKFIETQFPNAEISVRSGTEFYVDVKS